VERDVERGAGGVLGFQAAEGVGQEGLGAPGVARERQRPHGLERPQPRLGALVVARDRRAGARAGRSLAREPQLDRVAVLAGRHRRRPGVAQVQSHHRELERVGCLLRRGGSLERQRGRRRPGGADPLPAPDRLRRGTPAHRLEA
jgi:hypothetical protein